MWKAILAISLTYGSTAHTEGWPIDAFETKISCELAATAWVANSPPGEDRIFVRCVPWCEVQDETCLAKLYTPKQR